MGLFSSDHIFTAYAGSSVLLEEETRENTVMSLMLQGIISNAATISESIILGLQINMYARARSMVKYALKEDGYIYGLPEVSHFSTFIDNSDIQAAIERDIGEPIVLQSTGWGRMNEVFFSEWTAAGGGTGDILDYPTPPEWIQVRYRLVSDPPTVQYWVYEIGSGDDPILEDEIQSDSLKWQYLPIAVLMHDRVWFDELGVENLEKTLKRLLKDLTLDPFEIKEDYITQVEQAIADGDRPGSGELDDWDFFIHFATPIHSRIRGSRETIFYFLQFLEQTASWTFYQDYVNFLAGESGTAQPQSNFHISEGEGSDPNWQIVSTGYEVFYAYSYVYTISHPGEYTPPGWTEPLRARRMYSKIYEFGSANYSEGIIEVHGADAPIAASEPEGTYHDYAVFTRQNSDNTYTQVLIMAPSMMHVINTQDGIQYVDAPLFPEDPEEISEFRFPVQIGSLKQTSTMHREEMLQDSLCATVFLVQHQTVKWYQKTFFKWLIVIIVIIIVVLAYQYQLLPTIAAMAGAAVGATALGLWALYVIVVFAIGFLISFAGSLIGGKWGMVFVIVATLIMAGGNPFMNMSNSWANIAAAPGWGTAFAFIQATTPFIQIGMTFYQDYALGKLESEMREFMLTAKEKYQELQDAWDSFGPMPSWLDPMTLIAAHNTWYVEQPDNYFARTLNANPGLLGYDLINNFAEIALTLPENGNDANIIETMFNEFEKQRGAT